MVSNMYVAVVVVGCSVAFQSCLGFPAAVPFAAVALIPGGGAHISKLSLPFSGLV